MRTQIDGGLVKTIAKGGTIAFLGRVLLGFSRYSVNVLIARNLPKEDFGTYTLGFAIASLALVVALLGINQGVVRFIAMYRGAGDRSREHGVLLGSLVLVSCTSVALVLGIGLAKPVFASLFDLNEHQIWQIMWFVWSVPAWALVYILAAAMQARKQITYQVMILNVALPLLKLGLAVLSLRMGYGLDGVVISNFVATCITLVFAAIVVCRYFHFRPLLRREPEAWLVFPYGELFWFSAPLMLLNVTNIAQKQLEVYFLGITQTRAEVATFNAVLTTSSVSAMFLLGMNTIFSPIIANLFNKGQIEKVGTLSKMVTRWSVMVTLPWLVFSVVFAEPLLGIFGKDYQMAAISLVVLSFGEMINAATGPVGQIITMSGHSVLNLLNSVVALILNMAIDWYLIPRWGILGAAIGASTAVGLVNIFRSLQVYRLFRIHGYDRRFLKPLVAGSVTLAVTFILSISISPWPTAWTLFVGGCVTLVVYVGILGLFGFEDSDQVVLQAIRDRLRGFRFSSSAS